MNGCGFGWFVVYGGVFENCEMPTGQAGEGRDEKINQKSKCKKQNYKAKIKNKSQL